MAVSDRAVRRDTSRAIRSGSPAHRAKARRSIPGHIASARRVGALADLRPVRGSWAVESCALLMADHVRPESPDRPESEMDRVRR
jgi:hypothetical protein